MEYGNINWIMAIVSLLAGLGIGAMGYHLFGTGASRLQQLRRQVVERERELSVLKEGMGEHFEQVGMMVSNIQREVRTLQHRLTEDASTLDQLPQSARSRDIAATTALADQGGEVPAPRDYADGTGGTLSEDFGLKPASENADAPRAPRY
ncbi:YhcB family protein [Billgrantia endophytica]|uniref:YhcB family protein n=1 Tax=Billgrantia endophytica TaxID=2033802 RepID=UPI0013FDAB75|nr:DUF1043 family protein [Halomonas endophytica]